MGRLISITMALLCACHLSIAQSSRKSLTQNSGYEESMKTAGLFEGIYYHPGVLPRSNDTHIYLGEITPYSGRIEFRHQKYEKIDMHYDLFNDVLIVKNTAFSPSIPIKLPQSQIQNFQFGDKRFINLDTTNCPMTGAGFYQQLIVSDPFDLIAKRRKIRVIKNDKFTYVDGHRYFIHRNQQYHLIRTKSSFYEVFSDIEEPLKKYAKRLRLKPRENREDDLLKLSQHALFLLNQ